MSGLCDVGSMDCVVVRCVSMVVVFQVHKVGDERRGRDLEVLHQLAFLDKTWRHVQIKIINTHTRADIHLQTV